MPKRTDINSIMIIGAGPIIIGQACEFDYSGAQACKALREEGYRVILVNSNPATIMTDPDLADATYVEPITPEMVAKIIEKERPDALLPTMGGQTGLNTGLALHYDGTLEKYGVELIGARAESIEKAEDRLKFRDAMDKIGLESSRSILVTSMDQAEEALAITGLPVILRPSFTLGGEGGGICYNREEYLDMLAGGLRLSPVTEVLVEESILGWKEFEMEVVRDKADNCIIVCSIENIDPMGVHTGDSITVAPSLTLTDKELQIMRDASIAVLREIGVDTGGSNVQFAVNPDDGRLIVIEMNPRVSRSSALASKATGFPIAKIAAKLAVGYTLDELQNDMTKVTPASFEPSIDYVVTKIPRFAFEKFPGAQTNLTTAMKSVGEVMALGSDFKESFHKALIGLETGLSGADDIDVPGIADGKIADQGAVAAHLRAPTPTRILSVCTALRAGMSVDDVHNASKIDRWFLLEIQDLVLAGPSAGTRVYKRIDTCAAEFPSNTNYFYSTVVDDRFNAPVCEADVSDREKVMILGGGPNRIGQGIEFDYCCVHACYALKEAGYETIMVNCNPETVSTDYDTADRLYFEPLTEEHVLSIARKEQERGTLKGVIVQFGGQTPLKIAAALEKAGVPILGTSPDAIDLAEDRERFQQLLNDIGLLQPSNGLGRTPEEVERVAEDIGYPVLLRPSYVLGGRGMEIVNDTERLRRYVSEAVKVSGDTPVLIDSYLRDAIEVDVDAICDGEEVYIAGIMEHIEEAGIHSGDSACSLPPYSLSDDLVARLKDQAEKLAVALNVRGLMNVQFAVQGDAIYVLEVNPRASRTVPFVAKATGVPVAKIAARIMAGETLAQLPPKPHNAGQMAVKEAVFPFDRFPGVDVLLGPEMRSTGEVMGLDADFAHAFLKAQLAANVKLPSSGVVFLSVRDHDKARLPELGQQFIDAGFTLLATDGTCRTLLDAGIACAHVHKVHEGQPNAVDAMINGEIHLVVNTVEGQKAIDDSKSLRRTALTRKIPYHTTLASAFAVAQAIKASQTGALTVASLQSYAA
ncbi:carbamoyl-phosphate synthase large subunit [Alphaproteobacteria bacterium]|nr:carbamoyl-phosphate synthase large subunit [Alphaproteobacteria bacterium]